METRSRYRVLKPPVRWLKEYWDEEDVWFFFEIDEDGWVLRQVELTGPALAPTTASSLAEWPDADVDGIEAVRAYDSKYGSTADQPIKDLPSGFAAASIDPLEFERIWSDARAHLEKIHAGA
jgi:hypothetical protein